MIICTPHAQPTTPALIAPPAPAVSRAAASAPQESVPESVPQEQESVPQEASREPVSEPSLPSSTAAPMASSMWHALSEQQDTLRLSVELPGVSSLNEIEVGLSATEVVLARRDGVELLRVPMPRPVCAERAVAKFSKKLQRLTVTLPCLA